MRHNYVAWKPLPGCDDFSCHVLSEPGLGFRRHGWFKVPHLNQVWASWATGGSRCPYLNQVLASRATGGSMCLIWTRCWPQEPRVAQGALIWTRCWPLEPRVAQGAPLWTRCGPHEPWVTQGAPSAHWCFLSCPNQFRWRKKINSKTLCSLYVMLSIYTFHQRHYIKY